MAVIGSDGQSLNMSWLVLDHRMDHINCFSPNSFSHLHHSFTFLHFLHGMAFCLLYAYAFCFAIFVRALPLHMYACARTRTRAHARTRAPAARARAPPVFARAHRRRARARRARARAHAFAHCALLLPCCRCRCLPRHAALPRARMRALYPCNDILTCSFSFSLSL